MVTQPNLENDMLTIPTAIQNKEIINTGFLPNRSVSRIVQKHASSWIQPITTEDTSGRTLVLVVSKIVCR